ncbi:hypothetical protein FVE85_3962 [Porphyridium purpureum]|uniref:SWIM-type domain-containing protein n=1 Tax=Porphyridium purpureum TaxID=35688 RepID=A0A5J4YU97_PORPP|nr:hypothetical protein FVE85_3962 [Porphyridium purpureum]|eukprot:POR8203..scf229_5
MPTNPLRSAEASKLLRLVASDSGQRVSATVAGLSLASNLFEMLARLGLQVNVPSKLLPVRTIYSSVLEHVDFLKGGSNTYKFRTKINAMMQYVCRAEEAAGFCRSQLRLRTKSRRNPFDRDAPQQELYSGSSFVPGYAKTLAESGKLRPWCCVDATFARSTVEGAGNYMFLVTLDADDALIVLALAHTTGNEDVPAWSFALDHCIQSLPASFAPRHFDHFVVTSDTGKALESDEIQTLLRSKIQGYKWSSCTFHTAQNVAKKWGKEACESFKKWLGVLTEEGWSRAWQFFAAQHPEAAAWLPPQEQWHPVSLPHATMGRISSQAVESTNHHLESVRGVCALFALRETVTHTAARFEITAEKPKRAALLKPSRECKRAEAEKIPFIVVRELPSHGLEDLVHVTLSTATGGQHVMQVALDLSAYDCACGYAKTYGEPCNHI